MSNKLASGSFVIFGLFIGWIIYMANTGQSSFFFDFVHWLPLGDKIGHAGLFGLLTLLANVSLGFKRTKSMLLGTVIVSLFVLAEELSQYFLPTRTLDVTDLLADAVGILLATYVSQFFDARIGQL